MQYLRYVKHVENIIASELDRFNQVIFPKQGKFTWSDRNVKAIETFIINLEKVGVRRASIGSVWLYAYLSFQYEYWMNLETELSKGVQLTWIIGKKAIERYIDRPFKDLTKCKAVMKEFSLFPSSAVNEMIKIESSQISQSIRKRSYQLGNVDGLVQCMELTTMFDPSNKYCSSCEMRQECQLQLQYHYPVIFIKRGLKPIK